ncbi:MAG: hypothetical protein GY757_52310 [bacterium]|nr:hypothetical protein [bacterium]
MLLFVSEFSFPQMLSFRNYTEKNGLPASYIRCILQDSRGYLWFGTRNGVSRFDGLEFMNFSEKDGFPNKTITAVLEAPFGNHWVVTTGGDICHFSDGQFNNYSLRQHSNVKYIYSCANAKDGKLWLGTDRGLFLFDGKGYKSYTTADGLSSNFITYIVYDKDGKLWLATVNGLNCFSNNRFINYTTEHGLISNYINTLLPDSRGRMWVGTSNGLSCFQDEEFVSYTIKDGLSQNKVYALLEDNLGNIWIGTWNGFTIFAGGKFIAYNTRNGLIHNAILSMMQDKEGNIWFGTIGGLSCLKSQNIKTYSVINGLASNVVNAITEDSKGRMWFGTHEGLNSYFNEKVNTYGIGEGLVSNLINSLLVDQAGNIWIATLDGISVFSSGVFNNYTVKDGLSSNATYTLHEGRNGTILIGNLGGLDRFYNGKFSRLPIDETIIAVLCICEDTKGAIWFSSEQGLFRYHAGALTRYTTGDGLPDNIIYALTEDCKGNLWIGSEEGLSCYRDGKFTNYSTKDGLPANKCRFILEDDSQKLWFGTINGLTCFDGKSFSTYTAASHGFAIDNWYSGFKDSHGTLWFGSPEGIASFEPPLRTNDVPPPIHITGVKVMDEEIPLSKFHRLEYNQNYIHFEFTGLCYSAPESVVYKYRLEGIGNNWKKTKNRSIFYYLHPGNYRFQVKAINNDGIESTEPAELAFKILPAFWQTWWFRMLSVLSLLAITGVLLLWRYKRSRDKAELKNRTHQLLTSQRMELMGTMAAGTVHDLKNLLSIIMAYSRVVGGIFDKNDENFKNMEVIKETTDTAMHMAKQILKFSRVKTGETAEQDLVILLDDIIRTLDVTRPRSVHIHWEPPSEQYTYHIHPVRFQQLVMNLSLNAIHAMPRGGDLTVSLSHGMNRETLLKISDTGSGIDPGDITKIFRPLYTTKTPDKGTGLGLFVVKQILEEYKGKIELESKPGKGTTFTLVFPWQEKPKGNENKK